MEDKLTRKKTYRKTARMCGPTNKKSNVMIFDREEGGGGEGGKNH